ncbi:MAG TPA: hypothetical protein VHR66_16105 [Gemmataceae bacterium]|jgi:REP element-mobilizing transposase RayT|nr:hypothetical protein [Gemmataceae bacterium]
MDRHWLIWWTTYGSRVAGDARGFVSNVAAVDGGREVRHNAPGTDCDRNMPRLERYVRDRMLDDPFELTIKQAEVVVGQFLETTRIREFELHAAAVMVDHTHLLVGVPGDPDPEHLRELYKSWATRALKKHWELPRSGTFFTKGGSVRKKADETALTAAVIYVTREQPDPLVTYIGERWRAFVEDFDRTGRRA